MTERTKKRSGSRMTALVIALALFLLLAISGGVLAKYISQNIQKAEMISAHFHISSNYLKEAQATINVADPGPITIELHNYEIENIANVAAMEITYKIDVTNGTLTSVMNGATAVTPSGSNYSFPLPATGDQMLTHTLTVTPNANATQVTVKVTSTAPYSKVLSAKFNVPAAASANPSYTLAQDGESAVLTIKTNGYTGNIKIACAIAPDNTNDLMASWRTGNTGTLAVEDNETYVLRFFGTVTEQSTFATITDPSGEGLTIGG